MAETSYIIDPDQGIGCIKFGETIEQVRNKLGLSDETENLDESTTLWIYKALKLHITFQPG